LGVAPREVNLNPGKAAVTLSAKGGALSWGSNSTNKNVTVTPLSGSIAADRSVAVTISLNAADNSGQATVTFTATGGQRVTVSATWTVIS